MTAKPIRHTLGLLSITIITTLLLLAAGAGSAMALAPVKLVLSSRLGREVNLTETNAKVGPELEDVCTTVSKDECQAGKESSITGAFAYPEGVAGAPNGDVYVMDQGNHRVQELTSTGVFVSMFGWEVNATEDKTPGATQAEKNICTAMSGDTCKAGVRGSSAGQFSGLVSGMVVDPVGGGVYVAETIEATVSQRVQEFTAAGQFVLEIGREVNKTNKHNLCTQEEIEKNGVTCGSPVPSELGSAEHGAFTFADYLVSLLAVGGPGELLYVGDEHRVQEFKTDGEYAGEIPLATLDSEPGDRVQALALDQTTGDVYLHYQETETIPSDKSSGFEVVERDQGLIRGFSSSGTEVNKFTVAPRASGASVHRLGGLAIDTAGYLAVTEIEELPGAQEDQLVGSLYDAGTGHLITEFTLPKQVVPVGGSPVLSSAIAFNGNGELYVVNQVTQEVAAYVPVNVAELVTAPATCQPGAERESSVTFDCSLNGTVNPEGVAETGVLFEWGRSEAFGEKTAKQTVATGEAPVKVGAGIEGARPNETFYDRLVGNDHNAEPPELLTSEKASFTTPIVSPRVVGEPRVSFVSSSSAVMFGELNPENASTSYWFEYAKACDAGEEACPELDTVPGVAKTQVLESSVYGKIGTTLEASGLQPATTYRYQLLASNEQTLAGKTVGGVATGSEGSFTTAPAPVPVAQTGSVSGLGATSATISGSVNPDGQPAVYEFELGVYAGSQTQYGIAFSGPTGDSATPLEESLGLTGLQPGATYAYRIKVSSGYGAAYGEPVLFTTMGLPAVIVAPVPLPQLTVPDIAFPAEVKPVVVKKTTTKKAKKKKKKKSKSKPKSKLKLKGEDRHGGQQERRA